MLSSEDHQWGEDDVEGSQKHYDFAVRIESKTEEAKTARLRAQGRRLHNRELLNLPEVTAEGQWQQTHR